MKRFKTLLWAVLVAGVLVIPRWAMAAQSPFTVTVSTFVPNVVGNGSTAFTAAGYPNVTGAVSARQIVIDNNSTVERVRLWNNCASSTTATVVWSGVVKSSDTLVVPIAPRLMSLTSPCFSRETQATDQSNIKATLFYE